MNAPTAPHPAASRTVDPDAYRLIDDEVAAKLLALAYSRLQLTVILTVAISVFFFGLVVPSFPGPLGYWWTAFLLATAGLRYLLYRLYVRAAPDLTTDRRWAILFAVSSFLAGASWAFGPIVMLSSTTSHSSSLLLVTLLSVTAVATTALSAHLISMLAFIFASLLTSGVAMLVVGDPEERVTAMAVIAAAIMLMLVGRRAHETIKSLVGTELRLSGTIEELRVARDQAEAASLAKTRFLGNMSHELRTPLNAVIGAAQLMHSTRNVDDGQQHLIDAIKQSGSSLLHLIEGILDLSRIEVGALNVSEEIFNLLECVEASVATAAVTARMKGLSMACIIATDVALWRRGDPALLRQVLLNLLGNAVKFTAQGEIVVRVEQGKAANAIRISVNDTGIGIPQSALESVFEPFSQVDAGTNRRYGGSGLGLSIVRQLVEAMGGRIAVQSELAVGSTFVIDIVLSVAEDSVTDRPLDNTTIAYIEPDAASAEALGMVLQRLGSRASQCRTEQELSEWLDRQAGLDTRPWLLVNCDNAAAQAMLVLCRDRLTSDRVVGMTNVESHGVKSPCQNLEMGRYLMKPVLRSGLVSRLGTTSDPRASISEPFKDVGTLTSRPAANGKQILVVEDDRLNRTIVCGLLKHAGYALSVAVDGASALEIIRHEHFDLVLMDWHMPDMDGLEVTRRLRAGESGPQGERVPIVALTANAFAQDRLACIEAGMNDYVTKPVVAESLIAVIERWTPAVKHIAAQKPAPLEAPSLFDPAILANLPMVLDGSNPQCVEQMLELFQDGAQHALSDIELAIDLGDAATVLRNVHTLKSSSAAIGAGALAQVAEQHEIQLRSGATNLSEPLDALSNEYAKFENALRSHRAKQQTAEREIS